MTTRPFTADRLIEIVATYAGFGDHHSGTPADRATTAWLMQELVGLGASVREEPFVFDRFVCTAELRADDRVVPTLPVFYSAVGDWRTTDLTVIEVDAGIVGNPHGLDPHLDPDLDPAAGPAAAPDGAALALAVDGPDDLPVQCNRVPAMATAPGRPAVIVPGNWAERLRAAETDLTFSASLQPGASANVIATLGVATAPPVSVTTPLTGWTPAGGERGTGLAVALAMTADLATDHHVTFSACSGHELDHLGLRHHLADRDTNGGLVVHLGASVGAVDPDSNGPAGLGHRRMVLTTATGPARRDIGARAADANWRLVDPDPWPGEGGTWLEAGASVLSFVGGSTVFHTAADTAEATTPEALALAAEVAIDAARLFLADAR